jgi:hypothetical protein
MTWRKSSHSINNGQCAEVGQAAAVIAVRDSKQARHPLRTVLKFRADAWREFVTAVKETAP